MPAAHPEPVLWARLSWPELQELASKPPRLALWPLGTTEQHGKHLPVDVDVANCWEIARRVSAKTGVPVLPALPFGDSRFWQGWPGTLSLEPETLVSLLVEVAGGVVQTGFTRLVLLNGHVGNTPALAVAEGRIRARYPGLQVRALSWWDVSPRVVDYVYGDSIEGTLRSFHANDGETSVYLTHSPGLVDSSLAVDEPKDYRRPVFSYHSRALTRSGVIGKPSEATLEKGRTIVQFAVEDLAELLRRGFEEGDPDDVWEVDTRQR
ncbi:MAG TPA: creatininase family protein [Gaiellaceae bacterium]|nr:creatininase family protein [Gaiellaceae bacterium]